MATVGGVFDELTAPPRKVPFTIAVSSFLGGAPTQAAWLILALALVPIWYVTQHKDIDPFDAFAFWGETKIVHGTVSSLIDGKHQTMTSFGVDRAGYENYLERIEILGMRYSYKGPHDTWYHGRAYGLTQREVDRYNAGQSVKVEYVVRKPSLSRVPGYERDRSGGAGFLQWVFWGAVVLGTLALRVALSQIKRGLRSIRLLTRGIAARAELTAVAPSRLKAVVANRKLTYSFPAGEGMGTTSLWSTKRDDELSADREPVLYDADQPARALVLRHMPGHIEVDDDGNLTEGLFNPYNYLWLPVLCVLAWWCYAMESAGISSLPKLW